MLLNSFLNIVRREGRYGTIGTIADQATTDILAATNLRRKRIWAKWDWSWSKEPLSFAVVPGTTAYTVTATSAALVDRITSLIPRDTTVSPPVLAAPLDQMLEREFYTWCASNPTVTGMPTKYLNIGRNAAGNWQIILDRAPATAFTMMGYAKKILTTFTQADVVANTTMEYFPDGVIEDVLLDGVLCDVARIQGEKEESTRLDMQFEAKLKLLVQEQSNVGMDNTPPTTPLPDSYRAKQRARNGTTVA